MHVQEEPSTSSENVNDVYLMGISTDCFLIYRRLVCVCVAQRKWKTAISQTPRTELVI